MFDGLESWMFATEFSLMCWLHSYRASKVRNRRELYFQSLMKIFLNKIYASINSRDAAIVMVRMVI